MISILNLFSTDPGANNHITTPTRWPSELAHSHILPYRLRSPRRSVPFCTRDMEIPGGLASLEDTQRGMGDRVRTGVAAVKKRLPRTMGL